MERRAKGWIRVLYLDAWVSMIVFTISTVAFYMMGAARSASQGLVPKGSVLIDTLAQCMSLLSVSGRESSF